MPFPVTHTEEYLHRAYIEAIAARAGVSCKFSGQDYGTDVQFSEVEMIEENGKNTYLEMGYSFHAQMKATINWQKASDMIIYDMDATAYNKILKWRGNGFYLLLLMCLPKETTDWLLMDDHCLSLHHACYWFQITGGLTANSSTIRVKIPSSNLFTPDLINDVLRKVRYGGSL